MLRGLVAVVDPASVVAVVNTGDDVVLHGLHVSPDLDTVTYTLAGAVDPDTGWGLTGETWSAMDALERYGGLPWFRPRRPGPPPPPHPAPPLRAGRRRPHV